MNAKRLFLPAAFFGATFLGGLSPILPAGAQEGQPVIHGKIVIRTPDGTQEYNVDPSQIPDLGEGAHVLMMKIGPDGQMVTFGGDPNSLGMILGPNGVMLGGPGGGGMMGGLNIVDPGVSYIHQLIKRDDVRSELFISSKQRELLDAPENNTQTVSPQAGSQLKEMMKSLSGGDLAGKSAEEMQAAMAEHMKKIQEMIKSMADERDKKLASILTPKQMDRLKQLDLQWRGALALGVKPVADQAKLTTDQFPKEADLLKEYRQEIGRQLGFGMRTISLNQNGKSGAGPTINPPAPPATPAEMQEKMDKAKKEIEKAKKALEEKALKTLTNTERAQWSALTGPTFHFRLY